MEVEKGEGSGGLKRRDDKEWKSWHVASGEKKRWKSIPTNWNMGHIATTTSWSDNRWQLLIDRVSLQDIY